MATSNQSSTKGFQKLVEQITCPICLDHFTNPKVLPCFHSFCLHCLQGVPVVLIDGNHSLPCPTCRSPCPVPDKGLASLPSSFVINNLMEVYELMKKVSDHQHTSCENCHNTNADHYCKQCAKFLCRKCLQVHNEWKPNTDHQILSLDEVASTAYQLPHDEKSKQFALCSKHNEPLKMFCETCQELICLDCTQKRHKDHDRDLIADTYPQHKNAIVRSSLQPLNREFDRLTEAKKFLNKRKSEIMNQAETTKEEIRHVIAQIKNDLDETEQKLTLDVDSAAKQKVSVLDQQIKELNTALGHVADCRDHVDQCIKVGTSQQVLTTKSQMISRSQSVINSVKEKTFQPLEQSDIELVKSDIIEQIHNIGRVKYELHSLKVNFYRRHIPLVGKQSTVSITFSLSNGSPASVALSLIKCHLTPSNKTPVLCTVKESSQLGRYNVIFTPLTRGVHQLHVTVNGSIIPGSPVSIPVSVSPIMRGTPLKTITGLKRPSGVAVTNDGLVIVSEDGAHCITILDRKWKKIRSIGVKGKQKGHFQYPRGVAITSKGTILVCDSRNHRIQEFTMEGDCISCVGTKGDGPQQFCYPYGIAISKATGQVFVADSNNHRVQVLHPDLTFSRMFGIKGSNEGQFDSPYDLTVDSVGFVYVTEYCNHRVQKFTPEGQFVSSFGSEGSDPGQLYYPCGITVDDNDLLYINNDWNQYVTVCTMDGQYVSSIDKKIVNSGLSSVLSNDWFNGITFDSNGFIFVCFPSRNELMLF